MGQRPGASGLSPGAGLRVMTLHDVADYHQNTDFFSMRAGCHSNISGAKAVCKRRASAMPICQLRNVKSFQQ